MSNHKLWLVPSDDDSRRVKQSRRRSRRLHAIAMAIVILAALCPISATAYLLYALGTAAGCSAKASTTASPRIASGDAQ